MTVILGISAFFHDSAAALIVDGKIVAAAQEERFTRRKHDAAFPTGAIQYCLEQAGLAADDLDYVAFYEKPLAKLDRLLETYIAYAPRGWKSFSMSIPLWLKEKLNTRRILREALDRPKKARFVFTDHHESHAASAFFPSPFQEAAILTLDGVGEWSTAVMGAGSGNKINLTHHLQFPHSLGLLYSAFTYYCGFKVNSGEYKLMGLAPFGRPVYENLIRTHLIDLKPDGTFRLNMHYFDYCAGLTMTNQRFNCLFGGPPRDPESNLEQRHMDLAASIQAVTEEVILRLARDLHQRTKLRNLVLAGGVALNCVASGRLLREGPFKSIWIQPAAGDAGGALGAALFIWHQLLEKPRSIEKCDSQQGSFLGPEFSRADIQSWLDNNSIEYDQAESEAELIDQTAQLLADGKIVGWFQGRMEFGPRALGARSILGDPRSPKMQTIMNLKIKYRETFRPFAPSVLQEFANDWFEFDRGDESPYMLLVAPLLEKHRVPISADEMRTMTEDPDLRRRVNVIRSSVPAVTHVDYTARIQTVDENRDRRFYRLLREFYRLTDCPMLVNTSFNVRGEPIVCTPQDAYRCFAATEMDVLVLGGFIIYKDTGDAKERATRRKANLARFEMD